MKTKIIAGQYKGKNLENPDSGTRPLTHRMKTSLFDLIRDILPDANVLDLYAGGGNFGIEALSRGAKTATFVDIAKKAIESIENNLAAMGQTPNGAVVKSSVSEFISKPESQRLNQFNIDKFDIIFADPPYDRFNIEELEEATKLLDLTGTFIIKHPSSLKVTNSDEKLGTLTQIYTKKYGKNTLSFFQNV